MYIEFNISIKYVYIFGSGWRWCDRICLKGRFARKGRFGVWTLSIQSMWWVNLSIILIGRSNYASIILYMHPLYITFTQSVSFLLWYYSLASLRCVTTCHSNSLDSSRIRKVIWKCNLTVCKPHTLHIIINSITFIIQMYGMLCFYYCHGIFNSHIYHIDWEHCLLRAFCLAVLHIILSWYDIISYINGELSFLATLS